MVAIDACVALLIWYPNAPCAVEGAADRVNWLLEDLERRNEKILIPAPALAELLVDAGTAGPEFLSKITRSSRFQIGVFDTRAAVEVAVAIAKARKSGNKRGKGNKDNWHKVKFDHQIVAISKVENVSVLYSDDSGLTKFAKANDMEVVTVADLPRPPSKAPLFEGVPELEAPREEEPAVQKLLAAPIGESSLG